MVSVRPGSCLLAVPKLPCVFAGNQPRLQRWSQPHGQKLMKRPCLQVNLSHLLPCSSEEALLGNSGERPLHALSPSACTPSPQDLTELELLTQALEKAARVRKGISKAGEKDKRKGISKAGAKHKAGSIATSANTASVSSWTSETEPPRGIHRTMVPARGLPNGRLLSVGDRTCMTRGAQAAKPGPGLRDQEIVPAGAPQAPEAFTLKEKG